MAPLVFEIGTTAFGRFRSAIESAAAGLLQDIGIGQEESRAIIKGICGNLPPALLAQSDGESTVRCVLKRDGETGSIELTCGEGCDLSRAAGTAERIIKERETITGVSLEDGNSRLILQLRFPEGE